MEVGTYVELQEPYKGYRYGHLVRECGSGLKWVVELCGSGLQIELYEDELIETK